MRSRPQPEPVHERVNVPYYTLRSCDDEYVKWMRKSKQGALPKVEHDDEYEHELDQLYEHDHNYGQGRY